MIFIIDTLPTSPSFFDRWIHTTFVSHLTTVIYLQVQSGGNCVENDHQNVNISYF
jgi:hypothetical protein